VTPAFNETRSGLTVKVDGQEFTPEELVAMVLQHAVDISVAHAAAQGSSMSAPPKDMALTVPVFYTQRERMALLDAASLVDLNVLTLLEENTAAALQYAMDKKFANADNTESEDQIMLFYNMGASSLQVSLVHFYSYDQPQKYGKPKRVPAVHVLSKAWDETFGGLSFDHLLVEHLADTFNTAWRAARGDDSLDVRNHARAMTKLRIEANKVKHVLSANTERPVYIDALHDDMELQTLVTRVQLEQMAAPLLQRAITPVKDCLARAELTWKNITGIEMIGGGMRIPRIQQDLTEILKDEEHLELGLHMNADESMALGAAFAGANLSTAFRVRHVGLTDVCPFGLTVELTDDAGGDDPWQKEATLFKPFGKVGIKKTIAFTHDRNVDCAMGYLSGEDDLLPEGTEHKLATYKITGVDDFAKEMTDKGLGKPKVSLQFEMSASGIASLVKAEAAVEETYIEQEEVEVDDEDAANETVEEAAKEEPSKEKEEEEATEETTADSNETDSSEEEKTEKPKKTVLVDKVGINLFLLSQLIF